MERKKLFKVAQLVFLFLLPVLASQAQVVIGETVQAQSFSVLEISTEIVKGGMRLPMLTTKERDDIINDPGFTGKKAELGKGLVIYNTDTNCINFWNGTKWISLTTK